MVTALPRSTEARKSHTSSTVLGGGRGRLLPAAGAASAWFSILVSAREDVTTLKNLAPESWNLGISELRRLMLQTQAKRLRGMMFWCLVDVRDAARTVRACPVRCNVSPERPRERLCAWPKSESGTHAAAAEEEAGQQGAT